MELWSDVMYPPKIPSPFLLLGLPQGQLFLSLSMKLSGLGFEFIDLLTAAMSFSREDPFLLMAFLTVFYDSSYPTTILG